MGEMAEAILEGLFCECCGELIDGEEPGHPRRCGAPACDPEPSHRYQFKSETPRARKAARINRERHNSADGPPRLVGWATPAEPERTLNGPRRERRRPLDTERQIDVALEALRKRLVILLFNGVQVEDIDAPLMLTPVSEAYFLRLVPLAGG